MNRRSAWQDGRRAWARLNGWHQDPGDSPGHPEDAETALKALADISLVKQLTARAELNAVKAARGGGKSWPEIAVALGANTDEVRSRWAGIGGEDLQDERS
jgi:hypothetical protein